MMPKMFILKFLLVALSAQLFTQLSHAAQTNLVRVNLAKKVHLQKGPQGQPLVSYYANIGVGTPTKDFKMLLDINGREIWLPHYSRVGLLLSRLNYKDGYAKKDSKTSDKENELYSIAYHGTEFSGKAYTDIFEFRDVSESLAAPKWRQRFLAISSASNDLFSRHALDGVIAVNPWPMTETGAEMLSVGLVRAKLMSDLMVGMSLDQNLNSNSGGELTFGGFNPTKFIGALRYHQSVNQHAWELNLKGVMLGREMIGCASEKCTALISTSANDLYGPPEQVKKVLNFFGLLKPEESLDEQKLYDIDCLEVAKAPSITIIIDDAYYMLHPTAYIRKKTDGVLFKSEGCYIAILSNGSTNKWELGTNFISNYYIVFDLNWSKIAFAVKT